MSTSGQIGLEPISQQTSTRSQRTKWPIEKYREPETFKTDRETDNTETEQEGGHQQKVTELEAT
jgi:hypothetical protein